MRMMTYEMDAEKVAFTWRRMPSKTGGKGSYGHRHREAEEIYFVAEGKLRCANATWTRGFSMIITIVIPSPIAFWEFPRA